MLNIRKDLNVLIDPSVLLDERTLTTFVKYLHQQTLNSEKEQFFVSSTFLELLNDAERNMKDILFFSNNARIVDLKELKLILEKERLTKFSIASPYQEEYRTFYENLLEETNSEKIAAILFEEWLFLQKKSWVISRIKKPFTYLIQSGAVAIEVGKKGLDYATRKTLKKKNDYIITNADRLRALAKWIAVGGGATSNLLESIQNVLGELIAGIFLLIDPELIEQGTRKL